MHIQVADLDGVIEALLALGWLDEGEAEDRKAIRRRRRAIAR
jgi:hypothetical protein